MHWPSRHQGVKRRHSTHARPPFCRELLTHTWGERRLVLLDWTLLGALRHVHLIIMFLLILSGSEIYRSRLDLRGDLLDLLHVLETHFLAEHERSECRFSRDIEHVIQCLIVSK
jgi:hypothetical protein